MNTSLWDLKQEPIYRGIFLFLYHEYIPMGFETSMEYFKNNYHIYHEYIPMGFETLFSNLNQFQEKDHEYIPMGFETKSSNPKKNDFVNHESDIPHPNIQRKIIK